MKTKIIVVEPWLDLYSGSGLRTHFRSLMDHCRASHTGIIFTDDGTNPYWDLIRVDVLDFAEVMDFSRFDVKASALERKSFDSPALLCSSHFEAQAHFMRIAGDSKSLYEEISDKEITTVVTDFYKAFFLCQLYPTNFSLVFLNSGTFTDYEHGYAQFEEYKMLRRISPFSESYIDGTWEIDDPDKGKFEIHFMEDPRIGDVKGLIADTRGLALFSGQMRKDSFRFKKLYFRSSIEKDRQRLDRLITKAPINYALYSGFQDGHFWWDGREDKFRYCVCEVKQRIGYL